MELRVLLSRSFLGVLEERLPARSSKPQGQAPRMNLQGFGGGRIDYACCPHQPVTGPESIAPALSPHTAPLKLAEGQADLQH